MTKAELKDRLDVAIEMLTEIADHPRLPKAMKDKAFSFAEEAKMLPEATAPGMALFRVATVINPKTGKEATVPVKADGSHSPRFAHMEPASEWIAVRAGSWAEATEKAREGDGESFMAPEKSPKKPRNRSRAKKEKVEVEV
jgi:hypothetical protein